MPAIATTQHHRHRHCDHDHHHHHRRRHCHRHRHRHQHCIFTSTINNNTTMNMKTTIVLQHHNSGPALLDNPAGGLDVVERCDQHFRFESLRDRDRRLGGAQSEVIRAI